MACYVVVVPADERMPYALGPNPVDVPALSQPPAGIVQLVPWNPTGTLRYPRGSPVDHAFAALILELLYQREDEPTAITLHRVQPSTGERLPRNYLLQGKGSGIGGFFNLDVRQAE